MAKRPTGKTEPRRRERLSSVTTAMRLLKAFSEDEVEIGISALAKRLGIAKSTVHRLAVTLVAEGMLEQDRDSGKYRLGVALFRLGALVRRRMEVSNEARPYLYSLRETINESVHLAILDGTEIMYVYNLESTQAMRVRSDVGVRKPAHSTAEGQAILAFQPQEVVERVIAGGPRRAHAEDRHRPGALPEGACRGAPARLRGRGRGERGRHGVRGGADPRRHRRGGGGGRHRRAGDAAVEEGGGGGHSARDRDRGSGVGAARLSAARGGVISDAYLSDAD